MQVGLTRGGKEEAGEEQHLPADAREHGHGGRQRALQQDRHHNQVLLGGGGAQEVDQRGELAQRRCLDHLRAQTRRVE